MRSTKIINATYEETRYRLDMLGAAVLFVDWHKNALTIDPAFFSTQAKFQQPGAPQRIDAQIRNAKNLQLDLFGGEQL